MFYVSLSSVAIEKVRRNAQENPENEVIGLLLGRMEGNVLIIEDAVTGQITSEKTRATLEPEAIAQIADKIISGKVQGNVVGWYHSHPGFGVFISDVDMRTQMKLQQFSPYIVALVIDPTVNEIGLFTVDMNTRSPVHISEEYTHIFNPGEEAIPSRFAELLPETYYPKTQLNLHTGRKYEDQEKEYKQTAKRRRLPYIVVAVAAIACMIGAGAYLIMLRPSNFSVTVSPNSAIMLSEQGRTFSSIVMGGTPPYAYQWILDDQPLLGENASSLTFRRSLDENRHEFVLRLNVTDNAKQSVLSNKVNVTFYRELVSPSSWEMHLGENKTIVAAVSDGVSSYKYQWYANNTLEATTLDASFNFTPENAGLHIIYLRISDSSGMEVFSGIVGSVSVTEAYHLTLATNPTGVPNLSGAGWYDPGTCASITAPAYQDMVPGSSRYRFNGWTTTSITEIADPNRTQTTVLIDENKIITANYVVQYYLTKNTSPDDVLVIKEDAISGDDWLDNGTYATIVASQNVVKVPGQSRYNFTSWTGANPTSVGTNATVFMNESKIVTAKFVLQYYLNVLPVDIGLPKPPSGWYDNGTQQTASVASPYLGSLGTRKVCIGWSGTGDVPLSGTRSSVTFNITQASNITWNWKTQYLLTVSTDPSGINPQPTRNPVGETDPPNGSWYDPATSVTLTAQNITGYYFQVWTVDGTPQPNGVMQISETMDGSHQAIAHYSQ